MRPAGGDHPAVTQETAGSRMTRERFHWRLAVCQGHSCNNSSLQLHADDNVRAIMRQHESSQCADVNAMQRDSYYDVINMLSSF